MIASETGSAIQRSRARLFEILEATTGDAASRAVSILILALISLNVIAVVLETVGSLSTPYASVFRAFEIVSVAVFTVEYVLRLWSCTTDERFKRSVTGRLRFAFTPMAIVDLLAILPFYLPMVIGLDLRFIRALRLFRLFRLFKVGRYSDALDLFGRTIRAKREELIVSVIGILILLVLASSLMYFVENEAQPESFPSIPEAMWWGVATLTTVGYGDIHPITPVGKLLGGVTALLGIAMFALPTGILSSGFGEELRRRRHDDTDQTQGSGDGSDHEALRE